MDRESLTDQTSGLSLHFKAPLRLGIHNLAPFLLSVLSLLRFSSSVVYSQSSVALLTTCRFSKKKNFYVFNQYLMKFNQVILILFVSKCKITLEIPTTCVRILINDVFIKPGKINNLNVSKIQNSIKHSTPIKAIYCQW